MSSLLDLRATSYYPPSMAQGLRGSVYSGSMPNSRLGSRKPSPKSRSPHLPTPDGHVPNQVPDTATSSVKHEHPNLQVHLHISWESNLRLTLATSLLINYPSPMFMTLPIKLSVTGLVFDGQLAVAYQGERRRVHLCILDELDRYAPSAPYRNRDPGASKDKSNLNSPVVTFQGRDDLAPSPAPTPPPPNPHPRAVPLSHQSSEDSIIREEGGGDEKPRPIGERLLPNIYIESEIGQADKHVLKNVTRVERFIQDVIRKSVVEEMVFPNFHTLILGDVS